MPRSLGLLRGWLESKGKSRPAPRVHTRRATGPIVQAVRLAHSAIVRLAHERGKLASWPDRCMDMLRVGRRFRQDLAEAAFLKQETYSNHRSGEVARRLEKISCQDPYAAGIQSQRVARPELHAEVRDAACAARVGATVPSRIVKVLNSVSLRPVELLYKVLVTRKFVEAILRDRLGYRPRIAGDFPGSAVECLPKMIGVHDSRSTEIKGQISERLQLGGQASRQKRMS